MNIRKALAAVAAVSLLFGAAVAVNPAAAAPSTSKAWPKGLPPGNAQARVGAGCTVPACYDYAGYKAWGGQPGDVNAITQFSAMIQIPSPAPAISPQASDFHSLGELSVQHGPTQTDGIVEVGWSVDKNRNGDTKARLFTFAWVNGVGMGYGTGFVGMGGGLANGSDLTPYAGTAIKFEIVQQAYGWYIAVNGAFIGFYPLDHWANATPAVDFHSAELVQAFGEVASGNADTTCTDMGNRKFASDTTAAYMSGLEINRGVAASGFSWISRQTYPTKWTVSAFDNTAKKFRYGGPSTC